MPKDFSLQISIYQIKVQCSTCDKDLTGHAIILNNPTPPTVVLKVDPCPDCELRTYQRGIKASEQVYGQVKLSPPYLPPGAYVCTPVEVSHPTSTTDDMEMEEDNNEAQS